MDRELALVEAAGLPVLSLEGVTAGSGSTVAKAIDIEGLGWRLYDELAEVGDGTLGEHLVLAGCRVRHVRHLVVAMQVAIDDGQPLAVTVQNL